MGDILIAVALIICALVALILGLIYRKALISLIGRIKKGRVSNVDIVFEAQDSLGKIAQKGEIVAETLVVFAEQAKNIFHQGKPYEDYTIAFSDVEKKIRDILTEKLNNKDDRPVVKLKLISVAMTFSWNFVISQVPKILLQYSTATIELELLFIASEFLELQSLATHEINWVQVSKQRVIDVQHFISDMDSTFHGRMVINARTYKNLPHWHGWIVDNRYLFLGRTNWYFKSEKPKLLVGQNKYRYFDTSTQEGDEKVQLFLNWQNYYFNFASKKI